MNSTSSKTPDHRYPASKARVEKSVWAAVAAAHPIAPEPAALFSLLAGHGGKLPPYLEDLLRLEWSMGSLKAGGPPIPPSVEELAVNPSVRTLEVQWHNLHLLLDPAHDDKAVGPGSERLLLWLDPKSRAPRARPASNDDLLALKMVLEGIPAETVAREGGFGAGAVDDLLAGAVHSGILLAPASRIRRDPSVFQASRKEDEEFLAADTFTLQWHLTQACDLHCKHCYDRSDRSPFSREEALRVLDDLRAFCKERNVRGAVSFTGGNPLLHPDFNAIYRAAVERGFGAAVLGNPCSRERLRELVAIRPPVFFQVSLEGLREHNDYIRGAGHFDRIMRFLDLLREEGVYRMVMLTLTSANVDQVVPLAEELRERVDVFHFNRLALFGEGAGLAMVEPKRYREFLERYLAAARTNPVMGLKDNLLNILRRERGEDLFGGCAGYGCGAAFNFLTLLSDGEVHACRKLPSPLGNIHSRGLSEIYDSELARKYRLGPAACRGCNIRVACGGCLAVAMSSGLNIFEDKDPFCFLS